MQNKIAGTKLIKCGKVDRFISWRGNTKKKQCVGKYIIEMSSTTLFF